MGAAPVVELPVDVVEGEWAWDELLGWNYGFAGDWAYTFQMGFVWYGEFPWIYQVDQGWFYVQERYDAETVIFYSPEMSWILVLDSVHGEFYVIETDTWMGFRE